MRRNSKLQTNNKICIICTQIIDTGIIMTTPDKDFDGASQGKKKLTGADFFEEGNKLEQAGDDVGAFKAFEEGAKTYNAQCMLNCAVYHKTGVRYQDGGFYSEPNHDEALRYANLVVSISSDEALVNIANEVIDSVEIMKHGTDPQI